ncbi:hypothetical protein C3L33_11641, partial [Rhododendron williamsianum]
MPTAQLLKGARTILLSANALTDTILQGQLVTASTPITSSGNKFELGFFSPGNKNSRRSSYLGIWYKRVSKGTVVWVANKDHPLTDSSAVLTIAVDGNLVIREGSFSHMLSNISSSGNTSATLSDSGNLVLNDRRSGDILWQSFDYPSGMRASPKEQCGVNAYCGAFGTCNQRASPFCQCFRGFQPNSTGNWNAGDMSGGCVRKAPLQCGNDSEVNGQKDQFFQISKVRLPDNSIVLSEVRSVGDCEWACFRNCSCSAYTYDDSYGCSIWSDDLLNIQSYKDSWSQPQLPSHLRAMNLSWDSSVLGIRTPEEAVIWVFGTKEFRKELLFG